MSTDISSSHTQVRDQHTMSSQCLACHADSQVDTIASHPRDPGATHEHAGCYSGKACHKTFRSDKPYGVDFTVYDCLSCHDTPTGPSGD